MDKMKAFLLTLIVLLYGLTARILLQSRETIISKHPLFIYSVVFLAFLVLSFRMHGKAKTIMLAISFVFLFMYYFYLIMGA